MLRAKKDHTKVPFLKKTTGLCPLMLYCKVSGSWQPEAGYKTCWVVVGGGGGSRFIPTPCKRHPSSVSISNKMQRKSCQKPTIIVLKVGLIIGDILPVFVTGL